MKNTTLLVISVAAFFALLLFARSVQIEKVALAEGKMEECHLGIGSAEIKGAIEKNLVDLRESLPETYASTIAVKEELGHVTEAVAATKRSIENLERKACKH